MNNAENKLLAILDAWREAEKLRAELVERQRARRDRIAKATEKLTGLLSARYEPGATSDPEARLLLAKTQEAWTQLQKETREQDQLVDLIKSDIKECQESLEAAIHDSQQDELPI